MLKNLFLKFSVVTLIMGFVLLTSCEEDVNVDDDNPPTEDAESGTVRGKVLDTQGRPIPGAKVRIENDFIYYDVTTNAQGEYRSPQLPAGGFKAIAWATIPYKGQEYTLRMGMPQESDYDFFDPKEGVVRNFEWQINGRIPDREATDGEGYFGGTLEFMNGTGSIYDERMTPGDEVHLTLNPTGPLIDGSTGEIIERTFTIQSGNDSYLIVDIPTGEYEMNAVRITPEGNQEQLLIGTFSEQWEAVLINFQPGTYGIGTYESGVERLSLYMNLNR